MDKLKTLWRDLSPKKKKAVVITCSIAATGCLFMLGYRPEDKNNRRVRSKKEAKELTLSGGDLEKAKYMDLKREMDELKRLAKERNQKETREREELEKLKTEAARMKEDEDEIPKPKQDKTSQQPDLAIPAPPELPPLTSEAFSPEKTPRTQRTPTPPRVFQSSIQTPPAEIVETVLGGIEIAANENAKRETSGGRLKTIQETPQAKNKADETVYLPPSFMEATLLTGVDASTSGEGKNSPEPLLIRIQKPAVLPNKIKANLKGCFIIAEATGSLSKERAMVRLVSLSCLDKKGQAVIDQRVKGFVVDKDGKVGLGGRVVSKMGAATARAVIAGIFGGVGDAFQTASQTQTISPLGATQFVDTEQMTKSALGGGLSAGANTLKDFYLDLAKQATPVIEVGAGKDVAVVISEGVELRLRDVGKLPK